MIYAIPATAVLGAILLPGYIGGAICAHLRVGDPFFMQIAIGIFIWLGLYLRGSPEGAHLAENILSLWKTPANSMKACST